MILGVLTAAVLETVAVAASWVVVGPGILQNPEALAWSSRGGFWVADRGVARIHYFTAHGVHLRSFGSSGQGSLEFTDRIALTDPGGQFIYVADIDGARILKVTRDGVAVREILYLAEAFWPLRPRAVASLLDGRVFVADEESGILVTDPFDALRRLGGVTDEVRMPFMPAGLACRKDVLVVADQARGAVLFLDLHGNHRGRIVPGGLPASVDIRHDGLGAVVDEDAGIVRIFTRDGVYHLSSPPTDHPQPGRLAAVCFAPDGTLLVAERDSDRILGLALAEAP